MLCESVYVKAQSFVGFLTIFLTTKKVVDGYLRRTSSSASTTVTQVKIITLNICGLIAGITICSRHQKKT